jgi:hypothetical protein
VTQAAIQATGLSLGLALALSTIVNLFLMGISPKEFKTSWSTMFVRSHVSHSTLAVDQSGNPLNGELKPAFVWEATADGDSLNLSEPVLRSVVGGLLERWVDDGFCTTDVQRWPDPETGGDASWFIAPKWLNRNWRALEREGQCYPGNLAMLAHLDRGCMN